MKKLALILGGIFLTLLVAIISVPLFVDVDQYRSTITQQANQRMNGKLELGKLKLSLWGAVKINAESIKLSVNGFQETMLEANQFRLEIPFLSLLSGKPQVVAVLNAPKIFVLKNEQGKTNVLELMKQTSTTAEVNSTSQIQDAPLGIISAAAEKDKKAKASDLTPKAVQANTEATTTPSPISVNTTPQAPVATSEPTKVPAILVGASLGIKIENGDLTYLDKMAKSDYRVSGLDLDAKNLGLGSTMQIKLRAPIKGTMPNMSFEGPIEANAELTPILVNSIVKSAKGNIDLDASKLVVEMKGGLFKKTASMPLTLRAGVDGDEKEMLVKNFDVQFHEIKLHGKGRIVVQPLAAKLEITTDSLRLEKLEEFVPMLAAYQLKGLMNFNANVDQDPNALRLNGDLKVSEGSLFMKEFLKEPMKWNAQLGFSESMLNITRAGISAPDSDVQLTGTIKNFLAPQFNLNLAGKSFNVDKALVLPEATGNTKKEASFSLIKEAIAAAPSVNPMLKLAANPIMQKASGAFTAQLGTLTAYQAKFEQVQMKGNLQNLVLRVPEASLKTFGGTVKSKGEFDLKNPALTYKSDGSASDISAKDAFTTYFPKYKNTLEGRMSASWNVSGSLYPETVRMRSLKGNAKIAAVDGVLHSVDFQETINSTMAKVPFLKGRSVKIDDGFKSMNADLRFDSGVVYANPIDVQPRGRGFVIKGKSTIQESLEQETFFDVFDPQGILPKEFSSGGKAAIAMRVTGPITNPKPDYGYVLSKMASTAGKSAAKNAVENLLKKEGGEDKNQGLKNLGDQLKKKFKIF